MSDSGYVPPGAKGARTMGNFLAETPATNGHGEPDWIDHRASIARAARRRAAGEAVASCRGCQTELDVDDVAHSPRCPTPTAPPIAVYDRRQDDDDGAATALRLLRDAARELADAGATDEAIAVHFANVCTAALQRLEDGA